MNGYEWVLQWRAAGDPRWTTLATCLNGARLLEVASPLRDELEEDEDIRMVRRRISDKKVFDDAHLYN